MTSEAAEFAIPKSSRSVSLGGQRQTLLPSIRYRCIVDSQVLRSMFHYPV
jgi:hypothetical protein